MVVLLAYLTSSLTPPNNAGFLSEHGNVSSFRIFYNGRTSQLHLPFFLFSILMTATVTGTEANTPANDHWYLSFGYTLENGTNENIIDISFLRNGSVDYSWTS